MQDESRFSRKVQDRLKTIPTLWFFKTQMLSRIGIPDIIGCYKGKFFAWELKTEQGKATQLQLYVLAKITEAGGEAWVVRPSTFDEALSRLIKS